MKYKITTVLLLVAFITMSSGLSFARDFTDGSATRREGVSRSAKDGPKANGSETVAAGEDKTARKLRVAPFKLMKTNADLSSFDRIGSRSQHRNNLSTGAKIAIGVAVVVGVIAVVVFVKRCRNELGCGG